MRLSRFLLGALLVATTVYATLFFGYRSAEQEVDPALTRTRAEFEKAGAIADNGYYALMGMGALDPQGAEAVGRKIVDDDARNLPDEEGRYPHVSDEPPAIQWKDWPKDFDKWTCPLPDKKDCIMRVLHFEKSLRPVLAEYEPVLAEYRALWAQPVFRSPHIPVSGMYKGSERVKVCKLHLAQIVLMAFNGDRARAASELQAGLDLWRRILGQRGNLLIDRTIALGVVTRYVQTASSLFYARQFRADEATLLAKSLAPLSADERRMHGTLEVEGATLALEIEYTFYKDFVEVSAENFPRWLPYALGGAFYRRNWVANQEFRRVVIWDAIDRMTAREFKANVPRAQEIITSGFKRVGLTQYLFNGLGVFASTSVPPADYSPYIARAHDLDAYLRLVSLQARIVSEKIPSEKVAEFVAAAGPDLFDPYTEAPMKYDPAADTLSFDVAYEKNQGLTPVKVRFVPSPKK